MMQRHAWVIAATLALGACTGSDVDKPAPSSVGRQDGAGAAVAVGPVPGTPPPAAQAPSVQELAPPSVVPESLYVCVTESGGQKRQAAIELSPQVAGLCRRAPEMGPCQYAREACRRTGGRVFAAGGAEITRQTEAEYDKRVLRQHFRSN